MFSIIFASTLAMSTIGADEVPTRDCTERKFAIPIHYDPARKDLIKELHLYVSENKGENWEKYTSVASDASSFVFEARRDGIFSFALVVINKDETTDPKDLNKLVSVLHVRIRSKIADTVRTLDFTERKLDIPICYDPDQKDLIKELHLYVSDNKCVTWKKYASASPDAAFFPFESPGDGVFSFALVIAKKDGTADPKDLEKLVPIYHIRIRSVTAAVGDASKTPHETWRARRDAYRRKGSDVDNLAHPIEKIDDAALQKELEEARRQLNDLQQRLEKLEKSRRE